MSEKLPIQVRRVNHQVVQPIPLKTKIQKPWPLKEICPEMKYPLIWLLGPQTAGKTTAAFHISKLIINPEHTTVNIISSSAYNDDNWIYIRKWLEKKKVETQVRTDMSPEKDDRGNLT